MRAYHDEQWGRPVSGTQEVFERITLEAFQAGLSWAIVLEKRENLRASFAGFNPAAVAQFSQDQVETLMHDAGIIRNRSKITATIHNAQAVQNLAAEEHLAELFAVHAPTEHASPKTPADIPAQTAESAAQSKLLKSRGFRFVGPVTVYSSWQAMGIINDHLTSCWLSEEPREQA